MVINCATHKISRVVTYWNSPQPDPTMSQHTTYPSPGDYEDIGVISGGGSLPELTSVLTESGATLVGINDAVDYFASTNVEGALGELGAALGAGSQAANVTKVTASIAAAGGVESGSIANWFDMGLAHRLTLVTTHDSVDADLEFFADAAMAIPLYDAQAIDAYSAAYEDNIPWHTRDADAGGEIHYRVTNNGANPAIFTMNIYGIGE